MATIEEQVKEYKGITNLRAISDQDDYIHQFAFKPVALGTVETIDGKQYRVVMNTETVIVSYKPLEPSRHCDICGKPMGEGYYDGDCLSGHPNLEYYCSRKCMSTVMPLKKWDKLYDDCGDSFWTEWED